jgi:hypothetical protein
MLTPSPYCILYKEHETVSQFPPTAAIRAQPCPSLAIAILSSHSSREYFGRWHRRDILQNFSTVLFIISFCRQIQYELNRSRRSVTLTRPESFASRRKPRHRSAQLKRKGKQRARDESEIAEAERILWVQHTYVLVSITEASRRLLVQYRGPWSELETYRHQNVR